MKYTKIKKYKYKLYEAFIDYPTGILVPEDIRLEYMTLTRGGYLTIEKGYAWDGPSGPTIDTKDFMKGSLVHDVLYQLMTEGYLDIKYKDAADRLLQKMCVDDGMNQFRAWYVYQAVKRFGGSHITPKIIEV